LAGTTSNEEPSIFDLTLAELLNVKVDVASYTSERIIQTPAIVSRYNQDDLTVMGIKTLKDMLSFIPGFVLQENRAGGTPVMIRGMVEAFNQKVLFLLDDVPYWMPSHSEIPLLGIPIEAISHVEVIRGPGAIYYGSNASAGVIKIVTKQKAGNNIAVNYDSNQKLNLGGYYFHAFNPESHLSLAIESQNDNGYTSYISGTPQPPFFPVGTPDSDHTVLTEEMNSILARFRYQNFNINFQMFDSIKNDTNEPTLLSIATQREHKGYLLHMDQSWNFDHADFQIYSDYNQFYLQFVSRNLLGLGSDGGFRFNNNGDHNTRWRTGAIFNIHWNTGLTFNGGVEFEKRRIEDYNLYSTATNTNVLKLIESQSVEEDSIFAQIDYQYKQWRFLIGGRYTNNSQSGNKLTPRISTVYQIDNHHSIKLLYSVGFNSPNFTQLFINVPNTIVGNPNLKAELVKTTDLAYSYEKNNTLFVVNAYLLKTDNFIQRGFNDNQVSFFNSGSFDRSGIEVDYQRVFSNYTVFANLAYNHQGNSKISNDKSAAIVPKFTTALGVSYVWDELQTMGFSLQTISKRNQAKASYLLNANYKYKTEHYSLSLTLKNILGKKIIYPDTQDFVANHLIEGDDNVNISVSLKYLF
jgi:outer membrane receptor protein involved in Fe transport